MSMAETLHNENKRLLVLRSYGILDTPEEKEFDDLTYLTSSILKVPVCLVSLVDADRQWFKSCYGFNLKETPREHSFCSHVALNREPLIIENTQTNSLFRGNPLVTGDPYIKFYAGVPLITADGFALGSLCVIDFVPRFLGEEQLEYLCIIARQVVAQLELRKSLSIVKGYSEQIINTKSDFLASASHEIRTPLTSIIGFAETLATDNLTVSKQKESAEIILKNSQHLLRLVNDILDLSKIEAGKFEVEKISCSPKQLIEEIEELMSTEILQKHLSFKIVFQNSLPESILSDPTCIKQVLFNLLSNAIKFTEDGEIRLEVKYNNEDGTLVFKITDTGIGMTDKQLKNIFNAYTQAEISTSRLYGGTGLGLSIAKKIAIALGGDISVESKFGEGSTFCFTMKAPFSLS